MGSVLMAVKCNKCGKKYPEMWLDRDLKGIPKTEGVTCGECGEKCISRDWESQEVQVINIPLENGEINRFEYSFKDDNGKLQQRKVDPHIVRKHFEKGGKK